jgi:hypothetical protein
MDCIVMVLQKMQNLSVILAVSGQWSIQYSENTSDSPESTMPRNALPDPHDYPSARHDAEHLRREALDDFWRGADAAWACIQLDAGARLARSSQRLQARLRHRHPLSPAGG